MGSISGVDSGTRTGRVVWAILTMVFLALYSGRLVALKTVLFLYL